MIQNVCNDFHLFIKYELSCNYLHEKCDYLQPVELLTI